VSLVPDMTRRFWKTVALDQNPAAGIRTNERKFAASLWKPARTGLRQLGGVLLLFALPVIGTSDIQTTTQSMSANVSPYGKLSMPANVTLRAGDTHFGGNLAGNITVSYWARTSDGGGGSITVQANSDFSPSGGPSVSAVTYTCSGATLGAGCSGSQTLATSTQTAVVAQPGGTCTGGGSACSTQEPNTVLLSLSSLNKPHYKTGTYSAQITFTISTL
jgi:hypothetical protein